MGKINFDNEKVVTQDLPIVPIKEYGNLIVGEIISIELTEKVSEAKTGYQFTGYSVPNLVIKFKQSINAFNKDDRYSTIVFKPIVSKKNDGTLMSEDIFSKLVMGQFDHLKHLVDTFEGTANFVKLGKLPAINSESEAEELLASFKKFYEVFLKCLSGKNGEGSYKGIEIVGKFIVNNGEKRLTIPRYVNKGYWQIAKFNQKTGKLVTTLAFYGERITIPETIAQNPNVNIPGTQSTLTPDLDLNKL